MSSRRFFIILMMVMGILFLSREIGAQESKNLLQNPGFEESVPVESVWPKEYKNTWPDATEIPKGWGMNYPGGQGTKLTIIDDPEASHGGMKYIRLECESPKEAPFYFPTHLGQALATKPGDKYSVSIWAKGEGNLNIVAYIYGPNPDDPKNFNSSLPNGYQKVSSKEWVQFKCEFTIPEGVGHFAPAFHVQGTIDLDDACLSPIK